MGVQWSGVLQALWIGLVIQMVISVLCVLCACLWKSMKQRMSRPPGGVVDAERDLEMGTMNGGEGGEVIIAERDLEMGTMNGGQGVNHPGIADYEDAHCEGHDLEVSEEDEAVLGDGSNQQSAHVPAIQESKVQLETMAQATQAETERAIKVSVVADVAHTQQDKMLIKDMINKAAVLLEGVEVGHE